MWIFLNGCSITYRKIQRDNSRIPVNLFIHRYTFTYTDLYPNPFFFFFSPFHHHLFPPWKRITGKEIAHKTNFLSHTRASTCGDTHRMTPPLLTFLVQFFLFFFFLHIFFSSVFIPFVYFNCIFFFFFLSLYFPVFLPIFILIQLYFFHSYTSTHSHKYICSRRWR